MGEAPYAAGSARNPNSGNGRKRRAGPSSALSGSESGSSISPCGSNRRFWSLLQAPSFLMRRVAEGTISGNMIGKTGTSSDHRGQRMNSEISYALAALVCYGLGDFIYKRAASAGIAAEHFLMGQAWFFCPAVIAYAWITGTLDVTPAAWWGGLAGLLILIGFFNYVRSL